MKKIFFLMMAVFLFASKSEYLEYTNKLITYDFKLNLIDKIKTPFYHPKRVVSTLNKSKRKNIKKIIHISLISILNNSALINIETFIGEKKVKEYKKWITLNSKVEYCKVKNIYKSKVIFKCGKKLLIKRLYKNLLKIRIEK